MKTNDLYHDLLKAELQEASFKFGRRLQFQRREVLPLAVRAVEGSKLTFSPARDEILSAFNLARIQETSREGIAEIVRIYSELSQKHVFLTAPLGIPDEAYLELGKSGYSPFHTRSVLALHELSLLSMVEEDRIETRDSTDDLSLAFQVLNSFHPTSQSDFDASYASWLKSNDRARTFVAFEGGEPVGMGILSWYGDAGLLSSGVVAPVKRGKGIQKALIRRRIQEARRLGLSKLFAPGVPPFSSSEANLKSCGFQVLCHRSFWKKT